MIQEVHLDAQLGHDVDDGCEVEEPAKIVEEAGKESDRTTPFGTWSDGRPMINSTRRGNRGRKLGDGCVDEDVVECCDPEFPDDSRWSAIVCTRSACSLSQHIRTMNVQILTAREVPRATQALSTVNANPQILSRPYCRCNWSLCPEAFMICPFIVMTTSSASARSCRDILRSPFGRSGLFSPSITPSPIVAMIETFKRRYWENSSKRRLTQYLTT